MMDCKTGKTFVRFLDVANISPPWIVLFYLSMATLFTGVSGCKNCTDLRRVQLSCKTANDHLVDGANQFDNNGNSTVLCGALFEFFICVGEHIPECLEKIQTQYHPYFQSPYDCHPSNNITRQLQQLSANMCKSTTLSTSKPKSDVGTSIVISSIRVESSTVKGGQVSPVNIASVKNLSFTLIGLCLLANLVMAKNSTS